MFCKICGNELNEKAVICPKCGCTVEEHTPVKAKKSTSSGNSAYKVLKYISATLLILALSFMMLSIVYAHIHCFHGLYVSTRNYGYDFWVDGNVYADLWFNLGMAITSLALAFLGFICSVITFALSFSGENRKTGFSSYVMFIASITTLFLSILCVVYAWW